MEYNSLITRFIKRRPGILLVFCFAGLMLTGCRGLDTLNPARLYIHNAERAKLAQEARDDFDKYRTESLNVFDQMLSNLNHSDRIWTDSTRIAMDLQKGVFLEAIPLFTWKQFMSPDNDESVHKELLATIGKQDDDNRNRLKKTAVGLEINEKALVNRKAAITELEAKLKTQEEANKEYEKNIEEFREAIIKLAGDAGNGSSDAGESVSGGGEGEKNADGGKGGSASTVDLMKSIPASSNEGGITADDAEESDLRDDLIQTIRAARNLNLDPSKGPGFKITLISLAIDLAEAERDRTSTEIDFLEKVIKNGKKQGVLFSEANELLNSAADDYKDFPDLLDKSFGEDQKIANTIIKVLDQYHGAPGADDRLIEYSNIQAILEVIGNMAVVDNIYLPELQELAQDLASLEHNRSIQLSKTNALACEAIISRGLESLAIYHAGGIKPEEVARFIYTASLVAAVLGAD